MSATITRIVFVYQSGDATPCDTGKERCEVAFENDEHPTRWRLWICGDDGWAPSGDWMPLVGDKFFRNCGCQRCRGMRGAR